MLVPLAAGIVRLRSKQCGGKRSHARKRREGCGMRVWAGGGRMTVEQCVEYTERNTKLLLRTMGYGWLRHCRCSVPAAC